MGRTNKKQAPGGVSHGKPSGGYKLESTPSGLPKRQVPAERPQVTLRGEGEVGLKHQPNELQIVAFGLYFFVAGWMNRKQVREDVQWGAEDPNLSNLMVVTALGIFVLARRNCSETTFGAISAVLFAAIFRFGFAKQFSFEEDGQEDAGMWKIVALVHVYGAAVCAGSSYMAYAKCKAGVQQLLQPAILVSLVAMMPQILDLYTSEGNCGDTISVPPISHPMVSKYFHYSSRYIELEDGNRLATDIHLPHEDWTEDNMSFPTVLHLTRYGRNVEIKWPFNKFRMYWDKDRKHTSPSEQTAAITAELLKAGYAVVSVDIRGTGSSSGQRYTDMHLREFDDARQVLSWIKQQKWSDGSVAGFGMGYDGRAISHVAARGGVSAIAVMFTAFDMYSGEVAPGGVLCTAYLESAAKLAAASDLGESYAAAAPYGGSLLNRIRLDWLVGSVSSVEGWESDPQSLLESHRKNFNALRVAKSGELCKDDVLFHGKAKNLSYVELESYEKVIIGLQKHKVKVYNIAGMFAGSSVSEQAKFHSDLAGQSRLTIGPWIAGASSCFKPTRGSSQSQFPLAADIRAHFDCGLKQICASTNQDEKIQYFATSSSTGLLDVKHGSTWPPQNLDWSTYFLGSEQQLLKKGQDSTISHEVTDINPGASSISRWNFARGFLSLDIEYSPFVHEPSRNDLVFTSKKLESDLTITGSPILVVDIEPGLDAKDAVLFVTLQEVDESNYVHYLSEGNIRISHPITKRHPDRPVGHAQPFVRSFRRSDMKFVDGKRKVEIALEPVAHTIAEGHMIRLSLAGSDSTNFQTSALEVSKSWKIHLKESAISIPTIGSN